MTRCLTSMWSPTFVVFLWEKLHSVQDQIRSPLWSTKRTILDFIHSSLSPIGSKKVTSQLMFTIGKSRPMLSGDMGFEGISTGVVAATKRAVIARRDYVFCFNVFTAVTFGPRRVSTNQALPEACSTCFVLGPL